MEFQGSHAKSHLNKHAYAVKGNSQFLGQFRNGNAFFAGLADFIQNAHVPQGAGGVETKGGKRYLLGFEFGVGGGNGIVCVEVKHGVVSFFGVKYSFYRR